MVAWRGAGRYSLYRDKKYLRITPTIEIAAPRTRMSEAIVTIMPGEDIVVVSAVLVCPGFFERFE